jgi:GT2 family glycosyltransferase
MMHVAVSIVGFRNCEDIVRCIAALERSTHRDFEVVICENGGPAAFEALRRALPEKLAGGQPVTIFIADGNPGFAGGVNRCISASVDADGWWILNPDTEPHPEALAALVARLAAQDCEAVGATLYLPDKRVQSYGGLWRGWLGRPVSIGHGTPLDAPVEPGAIERRQNYLNGAAMLIGRRFWDVAGPMREDYFLYCEEVEWCLRALARGLRLAFEPRALVLHHQGATTGAGAPVARRPKTPVYLGERNRILLTRDCFPARLPVAAPSALVQLGLRYGRLGAWSQLWYALAGWMAGLFNRRGPPNWIAN